VQRGVDRQQRIDREQDARERAARGGAGRSRGGRSRVQPCAPIAPALFARFQKISRASGTKAISMAAE
jgi:hypothetical protein